MVKINHFNSHEKILKYTDKLNCFFHIHQTLIVTELDLTNRCNNHCPRCVGRRQPNSELSWKEIEHISHGLKALDNKGVILSGGGDPLLHPDFENAVYLLKQYGIKIGVNSNGLALTERQALAIAKCCDYFRISLDAGTGDLYTKIHGTEPKCFEKVIQNIKMMSKIKKQINSQLSFGTGFLTNKDTVYDMEDFVLLSKSCGVDFAQFRPFQGDTTDISEKYNRIKSKYETESFKVLSSIQKYQKFYTHNKRSYDKCRGMFFSTVITANARVYACLHHRQDDQFLIGDLRAGDTLEKVWSSYKKWYIYEMMDVTECPVFCRNDYINDVLFSLDQDVVHKEFL